MTSPPGRVLITGASGFVGRYLTQAFSVAFPDATLLTPAFDLTDPAAVEATVREAAADSCVHLAAISTIATANQDQDRAWAVNLHGSLHLARAILRYSPYCHLVFASS